MAVDPGADDGGQPLRRAVEVHVLRHRPCCRESVGLALCGRHQRHAAVIGDEHQVEGGLVGEVLVAGDAAHVAMYLEPQGMCRWVVQIQPDGSATKVSTSWEFIALGAVRPPSDGRFTPAAAQSKPPNSCWGRGWVPNSRCDCRCHSACISAMPPSLAGAGRATLGVESPRAGRALSCPIKPSAIFVNVFMHHPHEPPKTSTSMFVQGDGQCVDHTQTARTMTSWKAVSLGLTQRNVRSNAVAIMIV